MAEAPAEGNPQRAGITLKGMTAPAKGYRERKKGRKKKSLKKIFGK
jgi:hypothetical protein